MLVALLILTALALIAAGAALVIIPARIADVHASITAMYEALDGHMDRIAVSDPRVATLTEVNAHLLRTNERSQDRILALTHPAYLREFRRDQVAATQGKVREDAPPTYFDEMGSEIPSYPKSYEEAQSILKARIKGQAPPVAPPEASHRPAPTRAS